MAPKTSFIAGWRGRFPAVAPSACTAHVRAGWAAAFLILASGAMALGASEAEFRQRVGSQIAALAQEKAQRTPAQKKMDSQLVYAVKQSRKEPIAPGVSGLRAEVELMPDGRALVDIDATVTPALLQRIVDLGGAVESSFPRYNAIRARVPLDKLELIAELADVRQVSRADEGACNTGSVTSEGDATHRADAARSTFSVDGTGVKIGVLSDGVDSLATSQATGDLGPVTVLSGQAGTGDEGTAMLEIVYDIAPGAQLYYATANNGSASFAQNIRNLAAAGCNIIVDDFTYYSESPFQDGPIALAVNDVSAAGVLYFSSAGNQGNQDSGNACTWEGDFLDGGPTSSPLESGRLHDFGGGVTYNALVKNATSLSAMLLWSDALGLSANDYDLYLTDASGNVLASSTNSQTGTQNPYEYVSYGSFTAGCRLVIVKYSGAARYLHLATWRRPLTITTAGNVTGHNASEAANAFCVAATPAHTAWGAGYPTGPYPNPFNSSCVIEPFTSDGPRRMFYYPDGTAITPGNFSSTGGTVFQKPDFTAADGVATTVPDFQPFFGTSAAAPHAAAIAALIKSAKPTATPAAIRAALTGTAITIGTPGFDRNSGVGIIMAYDAVAAILGISTTTASSITTTVRVTTTTRPATTTTRTTTSTTARVTTTTMLYHPADSNRNAAIVIGEVTAYGAAWKSGATWSVGPTPIPIGYVTRAGYIWKGGEAYHYDRSEDPTVWPSNAAVWVTGP